MSTQQTAKTLRWIDFSRIDVKESHTCHNCKTKYNCEFRSPDIAVCDTWKDHFDLIKVEFEMDQGIFRELPRLVVVSCNSLNALNSYAQKELKLEWYTDHKMLFKGYYRDPKNLMSVYEIR